MAAKAWFLAVSLERVFSMMLSKKAKPARPVTLVAAAQLAAGNGWGTGTVCWETIGGAGTGLGKSGKYKVIILVGILGRLIIVGRRSSGCRGGERYEGIGPAGLADLPEKIQAFFQAL